MTADSKQGLAGGPPRFLVRAFWQVHRAIIRVSGGRLGLWLAVGEYPGWGDNLDVLAAHRSMSTSVVVFEKI